MEPCLNRIELATQQGDLAEVRCLYGHAALQDDADSQCNLASMYVSGKGGPEDLDEAVRLFQLAARLGSGQAQIVLGRMHRDGGWCGIPQDFVEARRWYGLAAAQGTATATAHAAAAVGQENLGQLYRDGLGGLEDKAEARRLFRLAAELGSKMGMYSLGAMCYRAEGGPQDKAEARRLYGLASLETHHGSYVTSATVTEQATFAAVPEAQYELAFMCHNGEGGPQDFDRARHFFRLFSFPGGGAAETPYKLGSANYHRLGSALYLLAMMCLQGVGGPQDFVEARRLLVRVHEAHPDNAEWAPDLQYHLARMCENGQGGPEDKVEARRWYELAVALEHVEAQLDYALFLFRVRLPVVSPKKKKPGRPPERPDGPWDFDEARRLFELVAARGDPKAQYHLSQMHKQGLGGPRPWSVNLVEARRLLDLAAEQGEPNALIDLAQVHEAECRAMAAGDELIAMEEAEKAQAETKRSKAKPSKKGKVRVTLPSDGGGASSSAEEPPSASIVATADESAAADRALQMAMETGDYETLAAALESHSAIASDSVRAEARALRDKLREKRKKQSQKQKRAHAGAMQALATLQAARGGADAQVLQLALAGAESHAAELPEALDQELSAARERLDALALEAPPAAVDGPALMAAVVLTLEELRTATDDFDRSREVGSGGFGKVFCADSVPSLALQNRPANLRQARLAIKRANQGLELTDLLTEIEILKVAEHAHLLPLRWATLRPHPSV